MEIIRDAHLYLFDRLKWKSAHAGMENLEWIHQVGASNLEWIHQVGADTMGLLVTGHLTGAGAAALMMNIGAMPSKAVERTASLPPGGKVMRTEKVGSRHYTKRTMKPLKMGFPQLLLLL